MSLINPITPPTPPVLTTAQKQARYKSIVKGGAYGFLQQMIRKYNTDYTNFWTNSDGLTPAECVAALGTDGAEAVEKLGALKTFINSMYAGSIPDVATPQTITPNQDGTITLGA